VDGFLAGNIFKGSARQGAALFYGSKK